MKILLHTLSQMIRSNKKMYLSLIFISAIGISLMTALLNSYHSLSDTFSAYFEEYQYPDVTVTAEIPFTDSTLEELRGLDGVDQVQPRLVYDVTMRRGQEAGIAMRCFSANEGDMVRYYTCDSYQGQVPEDCISLGMEACFVELAGYSLGDRFTITCDAGTYEGMLTRILSSPECAVVYRDRFFDYSTDEFGYAFLSYEDLQRLSGLPEGYYNQALLLTDEAALPADVEALIKSRDLFDGNTVSYTYETSMQKRIIDGCTEPLSILSVVLSVLFFLIAMLMIYLFMYQFITEERQKTGILMALGVSGGRIAALYFAFGFCILIPACLLGNIAGFVLKEMTTGMYQTSFYLPFMEKQWDPSVMLFSSVFTLCVVQLSTFLASLQILRISPSQAMKPDMETRTDSGHAHFPGTGYVEKVCLCLALRNKGRTLLSILSTTVAVFLVILSFQYQGSINHLIAHTFGERFCYDAQLVFDRPLSDEELAPLREAEGISQFSLYGAAELTLSANGSEEELVLYGLDPEDELIHLYDSEGDSFRLPEEGLVLEKKTADRLQVSPGDSVLIDGRSAEIAGIYEESMIYVAYCSMDTFRTLSDTPGFSGAYLTLDAGTDRAGLYDTFSGWEDFSYLSFLESQKEGTESRLAKLNPVVYIIAGAAFLIGFVIIYNMSLINLKEREKVFAVMLAIGVKTGHLARATFLELFFQYLVSLCIGIAAGLTMGSRILQMMETDILSYPDYFSGKYILISAAVVFGFMFLGHLFALRRLQTLNLTERLKTL